jgi:hypothetical protein
MRPTSVQVDESKRLVSLDTNLLSVGIVSPLTGKWKAYSLTQQDQGAPPLRRERFRYDNSRSPAGVGIAGKRRNIDALELVKQVSPFLSSIRPWVFLSSDVNHTV